MGLLSLDGAGLGPRKKCSREESNLHGFPHTVLSRTRLPFRHVSCSRAVAKVRGARRGARIKAAAL